MLDRRRRRRANIKSALVWRVLFAGITFKLYNIFQLNVQGIVAYH